MFFFKSFFGTYRVEKKIILKQFMIERKYFFDNMFFCH